MERTGGELIQDFLGTFEIPYVFGNPGTTEESFLAVVAASKVTYVLALHESSAVGIAAGYALMTGQPSVVSLHTYPGLANGMFNMRNALMAGVPLLVINGQQDSRFLIHNPVLGAPNTRLAETATKYAYEVTSVDDIAVALQRFYLQARLQPTGPVFLSIPMNFMLERTTHTTFKRTRLIEDAVPRSLGDVARALAAVPPRKLAIAAALGADAATGVGQDQEAAAAALEAKYPASGKRPSDALILGVLRHLDLATHVITEGSSEDAIVQDMAVRLGFRNVHFSPHGEGLGWAMPLGVEIGLATGKHAVCFVGDGGSLFSIHALWTAAKYRIPAIFICFVNDEYRLLKDLRCGAMGTTIETTRFVGMDFDDPDVDIQRIAEGLGAHTQKIVNYGAIGEALTRALAHPGPSFLVIDREP